MFSKISLSTAELGQQSKLFSSYNISGKKIFLNAVLLTRVTCFRVLVEDETLVVSCPNTCLHRLAVGRGFGYAQDDSYCSSALGGFGILHSRHTSLLSLARKPTKRNNDLGTNSGIVRG